MDRNELGAAARVASTGRERTNLPCANRSTGCRRTRNSQPAPTGYRRTSPPGSRSEWQCRRQRPAPAPESCGHGILVQLPLPPSFDLASILHTISADKDVDGFHLYNVGGLVVGGTVFPPCTPHGVLKLLEHENIVLATLWLA
jgi:hypothetical protein